MTKKIYTYALAASALFGSLGGGSSSAFNFLAANNNNNEEFKINSTIADDFSLFSFDPYVKYADSNMDSSIYGATLINYRPSFNDKYISLIYAYLPDFNGDRYFYARVTAQNEQGEIFKTPLDGLMPLTLVDQENNYIRLTFNQENATYKDYQSFLEKSTELTISLTLLTTLNEVDSPVFQFSTGQTPYSTFIFNKDINAKPSELAAVSSGSTSSASGLTADDGYSSAYNLPYTINLKDPQAWSYRFDQDGTGANLWEAFKSLFRQGGDDLNDQVFYSFKMPNGWSKYEINNINLKYKTLLTIGSSYDVLSNQETYDYFEFNPTSESDMTIWNPSTSPGSSIEQNTWPGCSYYLIDYNQIQNMNAAEMASYYIQTIASGPIGYTFEAAKNSDKYINSSFIEVSITPEKAHTNIGATFYEWNKIQTSAAFKEAFKGNQDILNFANQYMPTDDYQVINIAEVLYQYSNKYFSFSANEYKNNTLENVPDIYKAFYNYLLENGVAVKSYGGISGMGYYLQEFIYFTMVRFCDVQATSMELTNSAGESYVINVSVEPVDEENSGGESEDPIEDISNWFTDFIDNIKSYLEQPWNIVKIVLIATGAVLLIAFLGWIINLFKSKK